MAMTMRTVGLLAGLLLAGVAQAKVVVNATRVIYPAQEREVSVRLSNLATEDPSVLQVWLDTGDERATPDTVEVPFELTPPVFRMEPGSGQTLRLRYTGEPLAKDRETLFWFNVLEIPPSVPDDAEDAKLLQFAYRIRLKAFFRPEGLPFKSAEAGARLQWTLQPNDDQRGYRLQVYNPTPYFISFSSLAVVEGEQRFAAKRSGQVSGNMVAPMARQQFDLPGLSTRPGAAAKIEFVSIGDYGNRVTAQADISSGDVGR